jgi:hypothetical protein
MSAKHMGAVWDYELVPSEQSVLLALADHADHRGENAFPSVALLAWKTGLTERGVQKILHRLVGRGALVQQRAAGFHKPVTYRLVLTALARKMPIPRAEKDEPGSPMKGERRGEKGERGGQKGERIGSPEPSSQPSSEPGRGSLTRIGRGRRVEPGRCVCGEHASEHAARPPRACRRDGCRCVAFAPRDAVSA